MNIVKVTVIFYIWLVIIATCNDRTKCRTCVTHLFKMHLLLCDLYEKKQRNCSLLYGLLCMETNCVRYSTRKTGMQHLCNINTN
jgi:hypothetical protein